MYRQHHSKLIASGAILLGLSFACMTTVWAATPVNLEGQPVSFLQSLSSPSSKNITSIQTGLQQVRSDVDLNKTTHVRIRQTIAGYPVWGSDAVVHIPVSEKTDASKALQTVLLNAKNSAGTMNGVIYQGLSAELQKTPSYVFDSAQAEKALQHAIALHQAKSGDKKDVTQSQAQFMAYVDSHNKAHWAFLVSFSVKPSHGMRQKPTYILDAMTFDIYKQWDNIQTLENTPGGGFGGNLKMGKLTYDGLANDYVALDMQRDDATNSCYLANADVTVRDVQYNDEVVRFKCLYRNSQHNSLFWDGASDQVNGGYSPSNDALYAGKVVKEMYQKWYGIPVLTQNGKPMMLNMRVHEYNDDGSPLDNAYWDGSQMTFGDGGDMFYPLVSLGVGAHEISHGFTEQHSNLVYNGQSGGLNEAYSDMAAQAAEFYSVGHNSWQIGPEIFKVDGRALRYMDDPSKDCNGRQPGDWCSISNLKQYNDGIDVHFTSGIFNKAFYLMGTAKGWDTKKAFDVMVHANAYYWTANTSFVDAACGVLKATKDLKYDQETVKTAMSVVGIDTGSCAKA